MIASNKLIIYKAVNLIYYSYNESNDDIKENLSIGDSGYLATTCEDTSRSFSSRLWTSTVIWSQEREREKYDIRVKVEK